MITMPQHAAQSSCPNLNRAATQIAEQTASPTSQHSFPGSAWERTVFEAPPRFSTQALNHLRLIRGNDSCAICRRAFSLLATRFSLLLAARSRIAAAASPVDSHRFNSLPVLKPLWQKVKARLKFCIRICAHLRKALSDDSSNTTVD